MKIVQYIHIYSVLTKLLTAEVTVPIKINLCAAQTLARFPFRVVVLTAGTLYRNNTLIIFRVASVIQVTLNYTVNLSRYQNFICLPLLIKNN